MIAFDGLEDCGPAAADQEAALPSSAVQPSMSEASVPAISHLPAALEGDVFVGDGMHTGQAPPLELTLPELSDVAADGEAPLKKDPTLSVTAIADGPDPGQDACQADIPVLAGDDESPHYCMSVMSNGHDATRDAMRHSGASLQSPPAMRQPGTDPRQSVGGSRKPHRSGGESPSSRHSRLAGTGKWYITPCDGHSTDGQRGPAHRNHSAGRSRITKRSSRRSRHRSSSPRGDESAGGSGDQSRSRHHRKSGRRSPRRRHEGSSTRCSDDPQRSGGASRHKHRSHQDCSPETVQQQEEQGRSRRFARPDPDQDGGHDLDSPAGLGFQVGSVPGTTGQKRKRSQLTWSERRCMSGLRQDVSDSEDEAKLERARSAAKAALLRGSSSEQWTFARVQGAAGDVEPQGVRILPARSPLNEGSIADVLEQGSAHHAVAGGVTGAKPVQAREQCVPPPQDVASIAEVARLQSGRAGVDALPAAVHEPAHPSRDKPPRDEVSNCCFAFITVRLSC